MYTPRAVPVSPDEIPAFLTRELAELARSMQDAQPFVMLDTLYAVPKKPREGMLIKADGTTWNPGSGAGVYLYRASAWQFLG